MNHRQLQPIEIFPKLLGMLYKLIRPHLLLLHIIQLPISRLLTNLNLLDIGDKHLYALPEYDDLFKRMCGVLLLIEPEASVATVVLHGHY